MKKIKIVKDQVLLFPDRKGKKKRVGKTSTVIKKKKKKVGKKTDITTFDNKKLEELVTKFISYAPVLDQILGLAPIHLYESEHNWLANDYVSSDQFLPYICKLIEIKEAIEEEKEEETNPKFKFFRGNAVQFLLNPHIDMKAKINYLKCIRGYRVKALDKLISNLNQREFVNFCPWTTEKDYLLEYSIYHFYERDTLPIYYYVAYYAQLLDVLGKGYGRYKSPNLKELESLCFDCFCDPIYIFPRQKELMEYMVLNKEANANRRKEEKEFIKIYESKKPSEFYHKYIPLTNCFVHM